MNQDRYDDTARERIVEEPPKRVDAPVRTAFERDRARVVHAAASRRLAAKTQVMGPQSDDFVRNRLTHSLGWPRSRVTCRARWGASPTSPRPPPSRTTSATRRSATASACSPNSVSRAAASRATPRPCAC